MFFVESLKILFMKFFAFWRTFVLFQKKKKNRLVYIPTHQRTRTSHVPHISSLHQPFSLGAMRSAALICIFMIVNAIKQLFICLLAICIFPNHIVYPFFLLNHLFLLSFSVYLYILEARHLSEEQLYFIGHLFTILIVVEMLFIFT